MSEEHLDLLRGVVEHAAQRRMKLWLSAEYSFPAGEGRVTGINGPTSLVLEADPDARMRRLALARVDALSVAPSDTREYAAVVAVTLDQHRRPIPERLRLVWPGDDVTDADELWMYRVVDSLGVDGGLVDLLRPETTEMYISEVLTPLVGAVKGHLGSTVLGLFADHEGSYGQPVAWTPRLFTEFESEHGYSLAERLPLLPFDDTGGVGARARRDYISTVSRLYSTNFFQRLSSWCDEKQLGFTSHVFEESLQVMTAHVGQKLQIDRAISTPCYDSLFDWGLRPQHAKEAQSVAAEQGLTLFVENQGAQGLGTFRDLEQLRNVTNTIGLWGAGQFFTYLVSSDTEMTPLEPAGAEQPWWCHVHLYADLVSRISMVNASSEAIVDVMLYRPGDDMAARSWPLFEPNELTLQRFDSNDSGTDPDAIFSKIIASYRWGTDVDTDNETYWAIQDALVEAQLDYLIVDSTSLVAGVDGRLGRVVLGASSASYLVLPPMTWISADDARALREFSESGGTLFAVGRIPVRSVDEGLDEQVVADLHAAFGAGQSRIVDNAVELAELLSCFVPSRYSCRSEGALRLARRRLVDADIDLLCNTADHEVEVTIDVSESCAVWRPDSGRQHLLGVDDCSKPVRLRLGPGELCYVVPGTSESTVEPARPLAPVATLSPTWQFEAPDSGLETRRVKRRWSASISTGRSQGYHMAEYNDSYWETEFAGTGGMCHRRWRVDGPYENDAWTGLSADHPPDNLLKLTDREAALQSWLIHESQTPWVNLDAALGDSHGVGMFDRPALGYAHAYIEAEAAVTAELRVVADTCVDVWLGDRLVLRAWEHKHFLEPTEGFMRRVPIDVPEGLTPILIRVARGKRAFLGGMGFMLRLCAPGGATHDGVRIVTVPGEADVQPSGIDWLRFRVPPGAVGVMRPNDCLAAYLNGVEETAERIPVKPHDTLALARRAGSPFVSPICYETAATTICLGSWAQGPLADFIGTGVYRQEIELAGGEFGRETVLDCGSVGVVVEARVNGVSLGAVGWRPFQFDIGDQLRSGTNSVELFVTGTAAPRREAIPEFRVWNVPVTGPCVADALERSGLLGPVTLMRRFSPAGPDVVAFVSSYFGATTRRDVVSVAEFYAEDAVLSTSQTEAVGRTAIRAMFSKMWSEVDVVEGSFTDVCAADSYIRFAWNSRVIWSNGASASWAGVDTMRVEDGLIRTSVVTITDGGDLT